jgi:mercuric ion binding protein
MKTIKFFSMMIIALVISMGTYANTNVAPGTTKTEKIKVAGKCGMCKTRIEKAAMITGVSKANWDEKTQYLTVTYASDKVTSLDIQKKIAAIGHDTEKVKATTKEYDGLPGCCKYDRAK